MKNLSGLPIGIIAENNLYAYGFDGQKYYVVEGVLQYYITKIHLTFDEAKQIFDALTFVGNVEICTKKIGSLVKLARKNKLFGQNLFWFFVKKVR